MKKLVCGRKSGLRTTRNLGLGDPSHPARAPCARWGSPRQDQPMALHWGGAERLGTPWPARRSVGVGKRPRLSQALVLTKVHAVFVVALQQSQEQLPQGRRGLSGDAGKAENMS